MVGKNGGTLKRAGAGRPKGATNLVTRAAKEAIAMAAEELGGYRRMVEWAREDPANERVFWGTIYPKLIPVTLSGDAENPLRTVARIELVSLDDSGTDRAAG